MKFRAIDFVVVFVADMDRAITFYRDTLGIVIAGGEDPHPVWNELETEPVTVALFANTDSAGSNASIGIAVDDVQAAVDELRASGHAVAMDTIETPVCFMATMHDPDGNTLILHQRKDGTAG
jgi:predicted enzyme related to lactoylglutathione lyase